MKPVLILDANQRSALAATRSLGQKGIPVMTADETSSALAGQSRFSRHYHVYSSPRTQPQKFIADIVRLASSQKIDIVLPMTELTTELLLRNQDHLPNIRLPFADLSTVTMLSDKCALMKLAQSHSVPIPETWFVENPADLPDLNRLPYPLIIKPGKSWQCIHDTWQRAAVLIADNPAHAQSLIASEATLQHHPFMLQRYVSGHGQGIFALYNRGTPVAFFSHRRLREKPPSGGVSVLSESIAVEPTLLRHARTLLDSVSWHGVAMVEFKVAPEGTACLMEINTRFWGSLQLAIDAGVDFPWLLYQVTHGQPINPQQDYRYGLRLRWLLGDVDNLYLTLRAGTPMAAKLKAFLKFCTPAPAKTRHEVNRWGDMGPFWWELRQYILALFE